MESVRLVRLKARARVQRVSVTAIGRKERKECLTRMSRWQKRFEWTEERCYAREENS